MYFFMLQWQLKVFVLVCLFGESLFSLEDEYEPPSKEWLTTWCKKIIRVFFLCCVVVYELKKVVFLVFFF